MVQHTFVVGAPDVDSGFDLQWGTDSSPLGLTIPADFLASATTGFLSSIRFRQTFNDFRVRIAPTATSSGTEAGPDLTDAWRSSPRAIIVEAGGETWTFPGPGSIDSAEPYFWTGDSTVTTFIVAFKALTTVEQAAATITFDDGALSLTDFDQTDRDVDVLALITANVVPRGAANTIYADTNRGGTDTIDDGELGLGAGETLITRIEFIATDGQVRLNDNDIPTAIHIGDFFDPDVNNLSQWFTSFQTAAGIVSSNILAAVGSGYVRLDYSGETNLSVLSDIVTGTEFLFAIWRSTATADAVTLEGTITAGTPALAAALTITNPSAIPAIALEGTVTAGTPSLSGTLDVINPVVLEGTITAGTPALSASLAVANPGSIVLEGTIEAGTPSLSAALTVTNPSPVAIAASGTAGGGLTGSANITPRNQDANAVAVAASGNAGGGLTGNADITIQDFIPPSPVPDTPPQTPTLASLIDTDIIALLTSVSQTDARLVALIDGITELVQEQIIDVIDQLERYRSIDTAVGVWLDYIGERLAITRPSTENTGISYFGYEGSGSVGYDQGPYWSINPNLRGRVPIGDSYYRSMLKARALTVRSSGTLAHITAAAALLYDGTVTITEADGSGDTPALTILASDSREDFFQIVEPLVPRLLGIPAGVDLTLTEV